MIVFGLDIGEFEYAYRIDGPWEPQKGLRFDKNAILLDPYARAVTGQSIWGKHQESITMPGWCGMCLTGGACRSPGGS